MHFKTCVKGSAVYLAPKDLGIGAPNLFIRAQTRRCELLRKAVRFEEEGLQVPTWMIIRAEVLKRLRFKSLKALLMSGISDLKLACAGAKKMGILSISALFDSFLGKEDVELGRLAEVQQEEEEADS